MKRGFEVFELVRVQKSLKGSLESVKGKSVIPILKVKTIVTLVLYRPEI